MLGVDGALVDVHPVSVSSSMDDPGDEIPDSSNSSHVVWLSATTRNILSFHIVLFCIIMLSIGGIVYVLHMLLLFVCGICPGM